MDVIKNVYIKDGIEYTTVIYCELLVPKPRQTYLHTRSYADMRAEYDLLNCHKVTDDDVMRVALSMSKYYNTINMPVIIPIVLMVLFIISFFNIVNSP